jgi:hypothetical protein
MKRVISIVEGEGEVHALPVLLRRLAFGAGIFDIEFPPPIRVHRDRFLNRTEEFTRVIRLAAREDGFILVLLDADADCAVQIAEKVATQAHGVASHRTVSVVVAVSEFEGWFLAAAESIAGHRGLAADIRTPPRPERIRDAKGWLSERMEQGRYHEVSDQPALAKIFDVDAAAVASRSFRKFLKELEAVLS